MTNLGIFLQALFEATIEFAFIVSIFIFADRIVKIGEKRRKNLKRNKIR